MSAVEFIQNSGGYWYARHLGDAQWPAGAYSTREEAATALAAMPRNIPLGRLPDSVRQLARDRPAFPNPYA